MSLTSNVPGGRRSSTRQRVGSRNGHRARQGHLQICDIPRRGHVQICDIPCGGNAQVAGLPSPTPEQCGGGDLAIGTGCSYRVTGLHLVPEVCMVAAIGSSLEGDIQSIIRRVAD